VVIYIPLYLWQGHRCGMLRGHPVSGMVVGASHHASSHLLEWYRSALELLHNPNKQLVLLVAQRRLDLKDKGVVNELLLPFLSLRPTPPLPPLSSSPPSDTTWLCTLFPGGTITGDLRIAHLWQKARGIQIRCSTTPSSWGSWLGGSGSRWRTSERESCSKAAGLGCPESPATAKTRWRSERGLAAASIAIAQPLVHHDSYSHHPPYNTSPLPLSPCLSTMQIHALHFLVCGK